MLIKIACLFLIIGQSAWATTTTKPMSKTINDKNLQWGPCPEIFPKGCEVSVLQGDPAKGGSDVFLKFPGKYKFPAHSHTSEEHITLISGELKVQYQGEKAQVVKPGSYLFGPEGHVHQGECLSSEPCVLFINFDRPIDAKPYTGKL